MPTSLIDFLNFEDGTDMFGRNVVKELPLSCCIISQKRQIPRDDLAMQALV
jgi:hypothetical protein